MSCRGCSPYPSSSCIRSAPGPTVTIRDNRKEAEQDEIMADLTDDAAANCLERRLVFHASVLDLSTKAAIGAAIRHLGRGGDLH